MLFLKNIFSSSDRYLSLYIFSALELSAIIVWSLYTEMGLCFADCGSYYWAYEVLLSGNLDGTRTPLYPLLIGIPRSMFGLTSSLAVVYILQSIVFIWSIKWLGTTLDRISGNKKAGYVFTAIYALYPGVLTLCGCILSESLAVSLMTALFYLVSEAYYRCSCKKACLSGLICLLLWMQRPALLYVPIIMLVFWSCMLFRGKETKRAAVYGFCVTIMSIAVMGIYVMMFFNEYHKIGMTRVTTQNNYLMVRSALDIDVTEIDSPQLRADMDSLLKIHPKIKYIDFYREFAYLCRNFDYVMVDKFIDAQIRQHPKDILFYLLVHRSQSLAASGCVFTHARLPGPVYLTLNFLFVNNGTVFIIFLMSLIFLLFSDIRARRISYFLWLLFVFFTANYFTIWIGAPDAYDRLSTPIYPVLLSVGCLFTNQIITKIATSSQPKQAPALPEPAD